MVCLFTALCAKHNRISASVRVAGNTSTKGVKQDRHTIDFEICSIRHAHENNLLSAMLCWLFYAKTLKFIVTYEH